MGEAVTVQLTESQARHLTDQIIGAIDDLWVKVRQAYQGRAWVALGYGSWKEYVRAEFDTDHLMVPRAERSRVVTMLSNAGMSTRAIASATGTSKGTVGRELAGAPNGASDITGTDGKTYKTRKRLRLVSDGPTTDGPNKPVFDFGPDDAAKHWLRGLSDAAAGLQSVTAEGLSPEMQKIVAAETSKVARELLHISSVVFWQAVAAQ
jgi:hypothetical protein